MTQPILVTGGTGTLGSRLVPRLREAGQEIRVLTRQHRADEPGVRYVTGDLSTGEGAAAAVEGVGTILHLAGSNKGDDVKTAHLVRAANAAGTHPHLVYISVVGAERIPVTSTLDRAMFGYFASKRASERVIEQSGLPWTNLRATQFHDLLLTVVRPLAKLPIALIPAGSFQPIETDEVAARLVELALGTPAGLVPEMGGPQILAAKDIMRTYLRALGKNKPVVAMPQPGGAARAVKSGANLTPNHAVGKKTWTQFLADRVGTGG